MAYSTIANIEAELKLATGTFTATSLPTSDDVTSWITEADSFIDLKTGNLYSSELVSSQILDWEGNDDIVRLPKFISVTEFRYNDQNAGETPSWTTKTEDTDFYTYPSNGEIEIIPTKFSPLTGKKRFMITYTKGYSSVPEYIKTASKKLAANRVVSATVNNQAAEQSGGSVQVGTIKIEDPTAFSVSAYKNREAEVRDILDKYIGSLKVYRIDRAYDL